MRSVLQPPLTCSRALLKHFQGVRPSDHDGQTELRMGERVAVVAEAEAVAAATAPKAGKAKAKG